MDKAIEHQFENHPQTPNSIPGIGKVYSAGIIAEIGDIHRFDSQASVAKFAGLVWTQHQSGEFEAEHSRMIKSGNRYLRYYLLEAANSVRRCDSEFRRYYDLKFHEVNKYQHKRALALTARKLVRLVFRLLKGQPPVYPRAKSHFGVIHMLKVSDLIHVELSLSQDDVSPGGYIGLSGDKSDAV